MKWPLNGAGLVVVCVWTWSPRVAGAQTLPTSDDCRSCHLELEQEELVAPARAYESDVHAQAGFGCLACHGRVGEGAPSSGAGFLRAPERGEIPELCGRCHSDATYMRQYDPSMRIDQVDEYWTSVHGQRLREAGDEGVATCIDCHPAHDIRSPQDPESSVYAGNVVETCARCHADPALMSQRGIDHNQVVEYRSSVHGLLLSDQGDLSAPVCNDCHGNHGAAPPGISAVPNVCGQCHSVVADYFADSRHVAVFEREQVAGCSLCHGQHAIDPAEDELLLDRSAQVCAECHDPTDPVGGEFEQMAGALASLDRATRRSRQALQEAEKLGMEVSQALFELEDVRNARTKARVAIHAFRLEAVSAEVATGLAIAHRAEERGVEALEEHHFRRVGLGGAAAFIMLLILGLLLKINELELGPEEDS